MLTQVLYGALFGLVVAVISLRLRFLTRSGAVAAFLLAIVVYGIGGWQWTVPMLVFFLLSSMLSTVGQVRKKRFDLMFEKSGTRDWGQVAANGGVAGILVLVSASFPLYDFYPLYLGSLAAVMADTWGTEIGTLVQGRTISVLTLQNVESGSSGGISKVGTLGGVLGAAVLALSGYAWYADVKTVIAIVVAGVAGSLVDSLLGATVQVQFRCVVCGATTERTLHCGRTTERDHGINWIGNDVVNGICAATGALVVWGLMLM